MPDGTDSSAPSAILEEQRLYFPPFPSSLTMPSIGDFEPRGVLLPSTGEWDARVEAGTDAHGTPLAPIPDPEPVERTPRVAQGRYRSRTRGTSGALVWGTTSPCRALC
jgi:hypothetical protein